MKEKIKHPKVFISYAWGTEEYQSKVLTFAKDLQSDGVEVLLDKWSLKEGHDTYAYMEQSVSDTSVTNVLILLDPVYAEKANERMGGVGTETQIISPEIYNHTTQEKFLPVIMERAENGSVPKPNYLKSIMHFDLSDLDKYNDEYKRLVRRLFGVEVYARPELGQPPKWLFENDSISSNTRIKLEGIKKARNARQAKTEFIDLLNDLKERLISFHSETINYLELYEELRPFREEYLQIVKTSCSLDDGHVLLGDYLQELYSELIDVTVMQREPKQVFLHEIFIYTVVIVFKAKDYESLAYLLNRSYFGRSIGTGNQKIGFHIFYHHSQKMNAAKNHKDSKNYYSGTAALWIENIASDYCNKRELAFADVLLHNYSLLGANYRNANLWFPILYLYGGEDDTILQSLAVQLKSSETAQRWARIFGFDEIASFKNKISCVLKEIEAREYRRMRYSEAFEEVQLLTDYIKPMDIGIIR